MGYYRLWVTKGVLKIESKNHQKIIRIVKILGIQIPTSVCPNIQEYLQLLKEIS